MVESKNMPIKTVKCGCVSGAIFRHVRSKISGENSAFISMNVQITKRYYDESTKEWKETNNYYCNDIPKLVIVAQKCYDYIASEDKR